MFPNLVGDLLRNAVVCRKHFRLVLCNGKVNGLEHCSKTLKNAGRLIYNVLHGGHYLYRDVIRIDVEGVVDVWLLFEGLLKKYQKAES